MYALTETSSIDLETKGVESQIRIDAGIQSLSWMSKYSLASLSEPPNGSNSGSPAPQSSILFTRTSVGDVEKKFDKHLYYQEGWLATGNTNCMIGCTSTSVLYSQPNRNYRHLAAQNPALDGGDPDKKSSTRSQQTPTPAPNTTDSQTTRNQLNLNRSNFNQRGHKSDIKLVRWNEPFQKLASCDSKGVIYVWVKHEGRWSIELINDRGFVVTDFAWSHDGRMAVICYRDGFVLVGSVNGQRFWSHLYDLATNYITAATWTPNDEFIVFGLSNGGLMVVDENGAVVNRLTLANANSDAILTLAYNSPKFFIDEFIDAAVKRATETDVNVSASSSTSNNEANNNINNNNSSTAAAAATAADLISLSIINQNRLRFSLNNFYFSNNANLNRSESKLKNKINNSNYLLACSLKSSGVIYLVKSFDMLVDSVVIDTHLKGVRFEWSNCGKILAVGGYLENPVGSLLEPAEVHNYIHFYDTNGKLIYKLNIPSMPKKEKPSGRGSKKSNDSFECPIQVELERSKEIEERFTTLTWGHNDQRLFVACSNVLNVLRIYKRIPSLSILSQAVFKSHLPTPAAVKHFRLPEKIRHELAYLFSSSVKASLPKSNQLRRFVCMSNPSAERLHCTLKRVNLNKNNDYYILYLEYLGGLIPLLSARKISNLKPDFVIFDPTSEKKTGINKPPRSARLAEANSSAYTRFKNSESMVSMASSDKSQSVSSSTLNEKPTPARVTRRRKNTKRRPARSTPNKRVAKKPDNILVSIKSNVWGTKFKFFGHKYLPGLIGQIVYKTSLFHLQPRQMTITLEDLTSLKSRTITDPKRAESKPTEPEKSIDTVSMMSVRTSRSFKSIDELSMMSSSSAVKGIVGKRCDLRRSSTFSSISSLIDPIECVAGESEFLDNKVSAANEMIGNRLQSTDVTIEICEASDRRGLPMLALAGDNSIEAYYDYSLEAEAENRALIISKTLSGHNSSRSSTGSYELTKLVNEVKFNEAGGHNSGGPSSMSRRLLNILNAETVLNYIRKRKSFLKSNSLTYHSKDNRIPEEDVINEPVTRTTGVEVHQKPSEEEIKNKSSAEDKRRRRGKTKRKNTVADHSRNRIVLHNKPPIWNENSQVYQLDFGGRVTQESAKNFQVEYCGKQVMQFGRIETNAYTLDFEWPFTAVQAFSIALANITQRLK